MTTNHTPEPWTVEIETHRAPSDWFAAHIYSGEPLTGTYRSVARVPEPEPAWSEERRDEVEANAYLLAAAPELLAALEAILRAYTDAEAARVGIDAEDAWRARAGIPPWVERIVMPAVAKAKGGAS